MSNEMGKLKKVDISKGIKVGGFDFTIDASDIAHKSLRSDNDNGQCNCNTHVISLDNDMDETQTSKTFIHVVIEAVNYIYCDSKIEHEKIQQLSFGIHQVMESLDIRFGVK